MIPFFASLFSFFALLLPFAASADVASPFRNCDGYYDHGWHCNNSFSFHSLVTSYGVLILLGALVAAGIVLFCVLRKKR